MGSPTYEETQRLLRAPWREAMVKHHGLYFLGERRHEGDIVLAKPYHNDPDGWVSIGVQLESGERIEFTESTDRIQYLDEVELLELDWDRLAKIISALWGDKLMRLAAAMEVPEEDIILQGIGGWTDDLQEEWLDEPERH